MLNCDFYDNIIKNNSSVYKGFDCAFCSNTCRSHILNMNYKKDPRFENCSKWYNSKPIPKSFRNIEKTKSMVDFENYNFEILKELIKTSIIDYEAKKNIDPVKCLKINYKSDYVNKNNLLNENNEIKKNKTKICDVVNIYNKVVNKIPYVGQIKSIIKLV